MKKNILGLLFVFSIFFIQLSYVNAANTDCKFDNTNGTIISNLQDCLGGSTKLVQPANNSDLIVQYGFKETILKWVKNISIFLSIMAVGSIAYGALLLTISTGDDEKIKKAKDTVKWGMIGFLGIISAGGLIAIVINLAYTIAPK